MDYQLRHPADPPAILLPAAGEDMSGQFPVHGHSDKAACWRIGEDLFSESAWIEYNAFSWVEFEFRRRKDVSGGCLLPGLCDCSPQMP